MGYHGHGCLLYPCRHSWRYDRCRICSASREQWPSDTRGMVPAGNKYRRRFTYGNAHVKPSVSGSARVLASSRRMNRDCRSVSQKPHTSPEPCIPVSSSSGPGRRASRTQGLTDAADLLATHGFRRLCGSGPHGLVLATFLLLRRARHPEPRRHRACCRCVATNSCRGLVLFMPPRSGSGPAKPGTLASIRLVVVNQICAPAGSTYTLTTIKEG